MARTREVTRCETCGGLGRELEAGALVDCTDCEGAGQVPADRIYDIYGAAAFDCERWPSFLLPIPKEARDADSTGRMD